MYHLYQKQKWTYCINIPQSKSDKMKNMKSQLLGTTSCIKSRTWAVTMLWPNRRADFFNTLPDTIYWHIAPTALAQEEQHFTTYVTWRLKEVLHWLFTNYSVVNQRCKTSYLLTPMIQLTEKWIAKLLLQTGMWTGKIIQTREST